MQAKDFIEVLARQNIRFFTGVPDSLLNALCLELLASKKVSVGVNEGNCLAMAAGHYMASGEVPCVFMQNSGLGNIVNPHTSLAHEKVYGVPMLLVVGWRGEPGIKDEPQHIFMGEITLKLLDVLEIKYQIIDENTSPDELKSILKSFEGDFECGKSCALVVRKGSLIGEGKKAHSPYPLIRENAIESVISKIDKNDIVVSSTGKISRELFEIRERLGLPHHTDFLTVGSMGFASSVAAQIAKVKGERRVVCIDGDGAALMHLGCMATVGSQKLDNFVHIILDNELHESVGGVPTVSGGIDWASLATALGYLGGVVIENQKQLDALKRFDSCRLYVIKINGLSRADLGRPTLTAKQNIKQFMEFVRQ